MDLSSVKNITPNRNLFKKIMAIIVSILVIIGSFIIITNSNKAAQDTVSVLRVKSSDGLSAYTIITDKNIEEYDIIKKEYSKDMILAEDKDTVINKVNNYYLRDKSILFEDQIIDEKPLRNKWLYELDEDQEVVTIPYNYLECGGDVLLPGDTVRIRVTYETEDNIVNDSENDYNPNGPIVKSRGKFIKSEILFDKIVVMDMLNSNSHSIYELYNEVMQLDEEKRQEVIKSEEFLKNIQPRALLLAGTKEQMTNYAKYKGADTNSFLITILSRSNSEVILDQLSTLENEVGSWIEKN
ncbi:MAG: flagellar biosynthesis protein FlgA [Eubacteriales bacterium]